MEDKTIHFLWHTCSPIMVHQCILAYNWKIPEATGIEIKDRVQPEQNHRIQLGGKYFWRCHRTHQLVVSKNPKSIQNKTKQNKQKAQLFQQQCGMEDDNLQKATLEHFLAS